MRIATWNVNSLRVRLPQLLAWLEVNPVDSSRCRSSRSPTTTFRWPSSKRAAGRPRQWSEDLQRRRTARARAATDVVSDVPGIEDTQRRVLAASYGSRARWSTSTCRTARSSVRRSTPTSSPGSSGCAIGSPVLEQYPCISSSLGDFNIAPEDRDVHDPAAWEGRVHVSAAGTRGAGALAEIGFRDVFRRSISPRSPVSWWDYRMNAFRRNMGLRIDLVLASKRSLRAPPAADRSRAARLGTAVRSCAGHRQNSTALPLNMLPRMSRDDSRVDAAPSGVNRRRKRPPTQGTADLAKARRNDYDVSNTVQVSSPAAVCEAVLKLFTRHLAGRAARALAQAFDRLREALFRPDAGLPRRRYGLSRSAALARHDARDGAPARRPRACARRRARASRPSARPWAS